VSCTVIEDMPSEALDRMEQSAARMEALGQTWGDLADSVTKRLTAAGFRRHDLYGQRGGFHLSMWDDGVLLSWSTTEYAEDMVSPFEKTVGHAILPALEQILQATGFTARIIPEEEDNGGDIRVTGWQGPGGIKAAAEQLPGARVPVTRSGQRRTGGHAAVTATASSTAGTTASPSSPPG